MSPDQLEEQFHDHQRLVQTEKLEHPEFTSAQAGQAAFAKTQANGNSKRTWPAGALFPVAERYCVRPGSSAGIEQMCSWFKRVKWEQRRATEFVEERFLILTSQAHRSKGIPQSCCRGPEPFGLRVSGPLATNPAQLFWACGRL